MGQPTPPGDLPLFDGLSSEWNDIVGAFPEDKRGELAPKLKERIDQYEPLKGYADFHKSGITPDKVGTALNLQQFIENNPQQAYEAIGNFLGITPQQAKQAVEENNAGEQESASPEIDALLNDPRYKSLQEQVQTLMQVTVMKDQQERQSVAAREADASLERELADLRKKHGDFPEREIVMRMANSDMTAEQALSDFNQLADSLRRRPAPFLMGNGGQVPRNNIDVTKLTPKDTRSLAAQMMQQAVNEMNP
jgi:hypothetical protein